MEINMLMEATRIRSCKKLEQMVNQLIRIQTIRLAELNLQRLNLCSYRGLKSNKRSWIPWVKWWKNLWKCSNQKRLNRFQLETWVMEARSRADLLSTSCSRAICSQDLHYSLKILNRCILTVLVSSKVELQTMVVMLVEVPFLYRNLFRNH